MKERIFTFTNQTFDLAKEYALASNVGKAWKLFSGESKNRLYDFGSLCWAVTSNPFIAGGGVFFLSEWWRSEKTEGLLDKLDEAKVKINNLHKSNKIVTARRDKSEDDYRVKEYECEYYKDVALGFENAYNGMPWLSLRKPPVVQRSKFSPEEQDVIRVIAAKERLEGKVLEQEEQLNKKDKELEIMHKRLKHYEGDKSSYFFGKGPVEQLESGKEAKDIIFSNVKVG